MRREFLVGVEAGVDSCEGAGDWVGVGRWEGAEETVGVLTFEVVTDSASVAVVTGVVRSDVFVTDLSGTSKHV